MNTKKTPASPNTGVSLDREVINLPTASSVLIQLIEDYLYNNRYAVNRKSEILNEKNEVIPNAAIVTEISRFSRKTRQELEQELANYLYMEATRIRATETEPRLLDTAKLTKSQLHYLKISTNRVYQLDDDDRHYYYLIQYTDGEWGIDFTLNPKFRRIKKSNYKDTIKSEALKEYDDLPQKSGLSKVEEKAYKEAFLKAKMRQIDDLKDPACVDYFPWKPPTLIINGTYYLNNWEAPEWYRINNNYRFSRETNLAIPKQMSVLGQQCLAVFDIIADEYQRAVVFMWIAKSLREDRNLKALCLFSKATKIGKSTVIEYIVKALHGRGFVESSIDKLKNYTFESGRVANKTCLYLSEAHLNRQDVNYVKTLITSENWGENIKNVQAEEDIQKTFNLCLTANPTKDGDLYSILPTDDQAIMGRVIIPKLDESQKLVGRFAPIPSDKEHRFSRETIRKIAGMASSKGPQTNEQRIAVVELSRFFQKFETENKHNIDVEDPEISGFLDKDESMEAFSASLTTWKKIMFISIAPYILKRVIKKRRHAQDWYVVEQKVLQRIRESLNGDSLFLETFNTERCTKDKKITLKIMQGVFTDNDSYLSGAIIRGEFEGYLHMEAFDGFMAENNISTPNPTDPTPPAGKPPAEPAEEESETEPEVITSLPYVIEKEEPPKPSIAPKYCFIDFEYHDKISHVELVCAVLQIDDKKPLRYWLWNNNTSEICALNEILFQLKDKNVVFIPFCSYLAEARCFMTLGLNPADFKWLDPYVLGLPFYRNPETHRKRKNSDNPLKDKMEYKSMLGMLNYFCGKNITEDKPYKSKMIGEILALQPTQEVTECNRLAILDYCESDIKYLPTLLAAQLQKIHKTTGQSLDVIENNFISFSKHAVQMAIVSSYGIPFNREVYEDFIKNYSKYIEDEIKKCPMFFVQKKNVKTKQLEYVADTLLFEDFLRKNDIYKDWPKTSTGKAEMTDDVFESFIESYVNKSIAFTSYLKAEGLYEQVPKTVKGNVDRSKEAIQQLSGLTGKLIPDEFNWDYKDDLARYALCKKEKSGRGCFNPANPEGIDKSVANNRDGWLCQFSNLGVYGTKTGRNHPGGKSCILQAAKHLSNQLVLPPIGYTLLQADFEKQEIWIAAALSGDKTLMNDVIATDVYITLGISSGMLPPEATKKTHGRERTAFKTAFIAWFYGSGAKTFSEQAGITILQAEMAMEKMSNRYKDFIKFRYEQKRFYEKNKYLILKDGWFLASEEYSNTVGNFPIQGSGAMLLRKIVDLALKNNVKLIYTLHDEFGILCPTSDVEDAKAVITNCMQDACKFYFPNLIPCGVEFKPLRSN